MNRKIAMIQLRWESNQSAIAGRKFILPITSINFLPTINNQLKNDDGDFSLCPSLFVSLDRSYRQRRDWTIWRKRRDSNRLGIAGNTLVFMNTFTNVFPTIENQPWIRHSGFFFFFNCCSSVCHTHIHDRC